MLKEQENIYLDQPGFSLSPSLLDYPREVQISIDGVTSEMEMISFTMALGGHPADPLKLQRYSKKPKKFYLYLQSAGNKNGGKEKCDQVTRCGSDIFLFILKFTQNLKPIDGSKFRYHLLS